MPDGSTVGQVAGLSPAIVPLLREIGDLKRVRTPDLGERTLAERMFLRGWGRVMRGDALEDVAYAQLAYAVAAARLGALDHAKLMELSLSDEEAAEVQRRSLSEVARPLSPTLAGRLRDEIGQAEPSTEALAPTFAQALCRQPRAGVTCPGRARVMLQPEESHGSHCEIVAVYAGLLAPSFGADPVRSWWFGMAHHVHSARMPDAGFTGEVLLEPHLEKVIEAARSLSLRELEEELEGDGAGLRARIEPVFGEIASDDTAEARAFHAADVIDRVLEIEYHTRANALTMDRVLNDYELVHDGPVKTFHDDVLAAVALP